MVTKRNRVESSGWVLQKLEDYTKTLPFCCGDDDSDSFFRKDALLHKNELLTETYYLIQEGQDFLAALVSLCNDAVRFEKVKGRILLPSEKQYTSLPAVKIARLGVQKEFQDKNVGTHVINMIKGLFLIDNRTGCRLLTVDAYNKERVMSFYRKNEFQFITSKDQNREIRAMFFDLKRLVLNS